MAAKCYTKLMKQSHCHVPLKLLLRWLTSSLHTLVAVAHFANYLDFVTQFANYLHVAGLHFEHRGHLLFHVAHLNKDLAHVTTNRLFFLPNLISAVLVRDRDASVSVSASAAHLSASPSAGAASAAPLSVSSARLAVSAARLAVSFALLEVSAAAQDSPPLPSCVTAARPPAIAPSSICVVC